MELVPPQNESKERDIETIRAQYKELCNAAGALSYQIKSQEIELQAVMEVMSQVNFEAAQAVEKMKGTSDGSSEV